MPKYNSEKSFSNQGIGIKVRSWNVRGVKDPIKRQVIFADANNNNIKMLCLQETHLDKGTVNLLKHRKYQTQFHSTHTSYSRGVSVLIDSGLVFSCSHCKIDTEGRYVFLHCRIETREYVVAGIYIPPPFGIETLWDLMEFIMDRPGVPVIVAGDFNMTMNKNIDKFPVGAPSARADSPLSQFCGEMGLVDVWRRRHPMEKQFSCHSRTHSTLSRIDLVLCNEEAMGVLGEVVYEPRSISDHSSMTFEIKTNRGYNKRDWKLNPFWLEVIKEPEGINGSLKEFIEVNTGSASMGIIWDTLKAFLRGILIQKISLIKKQTRAIELAASEKVKSLEIRYINNPSQEEHKKWLEAQEEYKKIIRRKAENKKLFQKQNLFGEGERVGRILAMAARDDNSPTIIPAIHDENGEIKRDTPEIMQVFKRYYQNLYSSNWHNNSEGEMVTFFAGLKIHRLTEQDREELEAPLTLGEIQLATKEMAGQKSPGPDGLPIEIYKTYSEVLLPKLLEVFNWAAEAGKMPGSMEEATIITLLKEGKDQLEANSYRPISLLCADTKILAKILATRLNRIVTKLVHPDQTGFIPGRSTSSNIRRTFLNIQLPVVEREARAILSLDATKAFDSLEWQYLWKVLEEYRFGPKFTQWVRLLYGNPRAKVRVNGECSDWFRLARGTRQGCPLSPLLFALAIEPLATAIRASPGIKGFKRKLGEEKVALYADDILLFLGDTQASLATAMNIIGEFGRFSGLTINWEKSALLPLEPLRGQIDQVKVVPQIRYLGINMTKDPGQYIGGNLVPLLTKMKQKCRFWNRLPLSVVGRSNLIKMVWMPQILYILHNSPVWIPKRWFRKIEGVFRELIWKGGIARISLRALQYPREKGGLALLNPRFYFLAAQLQHMRNSNQRGPRVVMNDTSHDTEVEAVEADSFHSKCPTVQLMVKCWKEGKKILGYTGFSEFSPIWDNSNLQELKIMGKVDEWDRLGIHLLEQLFAVGRIKTFQEIREEFSVPNRSFYRYLQIRHALGAQFGDGMPEWNGMAIFRNLVNTEDTRGVISTIYDSLERADRSEIMANKIKEKWEKDVGTISQDQWEQILGIGPELSMSPSQYMSQLYLIHRTYYTPQRMFQFGRRPDPGCQRCGQDKGDLIHMVWRCPKLYQYWKQIVEKINRTFGTLLQPEARLCVLGLVEERVPSKGERIAIRRCLFQGRKLIAQKWQAVNPPTVTEWEEVINDTIRKEQFIYTKRGNKKKFNNIWNKWIDGWARWMRGGGLGNGNELENV